MLLSWNEIKTRAAAFVLEWKDRKTIKEKAEAQTFETEFLKIFGVDRKKLRFLRKKSVSQMGNEVISTFSGKVISSLK